MLLAWTPDDVAASLVKKGFVGDKFVEADRWWKFKGILSDFYLHVFDTVVADSEQNCLKIYNDSGKLG